MSVRALLTAATTVIVAIALSVLVPIAQLRTAVEKTPCCCPNPKTCKCKHDPGDPTQTSMKSCHQNPPAVAGTTLPAFVAPELAETRAPARIAIAIVTPLSDPHPAPAPRRPDAPS
ncbi:MAG TPA: hypothetical protein VL326_33335 [Kofleriaceae bacterium]|nr:hypothetical protein [Kofleriaceae bacterium]